MLRTIFYLSLICLLSDHGQTAASDQRSAPKAYLPQNIYEFSPILEGLPVVHEFTVHNRGDAPLQILKIRSG